MCGQLDLDRTAPTVRAYGLESTATPQRDSDIIPQAIAKKLEGIKQRALPGAVGSDENRQWRNLRQLEIAETAVVLDPQRACRRIDSPPALSVCRESALGDLVDAGLADSG